MLPYSQIFQIYIKRGFLCLFCAMEFVLLQLKIALALIPGTLHCKLLSNLLSILILKSFSVLLLSKYFLLIEYLCLTFHKAIHFPFSRLIYILLPTSLLSRSLILYSWVIGVFHSFFPYCKNNAYYRKTLKEKESVQPHSRGNWHKFQVYLLIISLSVYR